MRVKLVAAAGLLACGMISAVLLAADPAAAAGTRQQAILVTGASTGLGRHLTERLASEGYFVYATARKDKDLAELSKLANVQAIRLDVTRPDDIAAALETVTKAGRGLYALVNNAGVGTGFPILEGNDAEFDLCMQVNVYGPYRMTRAFAPLVVAAKGRIVNMGSMVGLFAFKNGAAYTMSKHAIEAFSDALGAELESAGVFVSVIEPGNYNSEIGKHALERGLKFDPRLADRSIYKDPAEVTDAVRHALFDAAPRRRYLVVPREEEAMWAIANQLRRVVETNESQAYRFDRAKLIEILDDLIAEQAPKAAAAK